MDSKQFFKIVKDVTSTWDKIREIPEYETKVGSLLFKTLFEKHPDIFEHFPFGEEYKKMKSLLQGFNKLSTIMPEQKTSQLYTTSQKKGTAQQMNVELLRKGFDFEKNPKFVQHGQRWVHMFSLAINMLGPDLNIVEHEFLMLGERHIPYNVSCRQYRIMGKILLETLETVLGKQIFNDEIKHSWTKFYSFIHKTMLKGMETSKYSELHQQSSSTVPLKSLSRSKTSPSASSTPPRVSSPSSQPPPRRRKSTPPGKNLAQVTDERERQRSADALAGYRQRIMDRHSSVRHLAS